LADPSQIDQILANLCVNARDAIAGVGKITIETAKVTFDTAHCADHPGFVPGDFVLLAVSDDGCGMEKGIIDHVFEPFFTTKEIGRGTGLGLATVYGIVKQNKGFISVYSEPAKGTTFKIYLPCQAGEADLAEVHSEKELPAGSGETVLLVEDEVSLLALARRILTELGYAVLEAATPGQALALAREHAGSIDLLLTDVVMPEMNGRELAGQLQGTFPELKVLYMSGYTANVIAHHGVLETGVHFIPKPFTKRELAGKVREVLEQG
jgi:two-component system sensor histidine kinase EvgS